MRLHTWRSASRTTPKRHGTLPHGGRRTTGPSGASSGPASQSSKGSCPPSISGTLGVLWVDGFFYPSQNSRVPKPVSTPLTRVLILLLWLHWLILRELLASIEVPYTMHDLPLQFCRHAMARRFAHQGRAYSVTRLADSYKDNNVLAKTCCDCKIGAGCACWQRNFLRRKLVNFHQHDPLQQLHH